MDLVTVFTSFNLSEAEIVASRLEAAGFNPFVADESASSWRGGYSNTIPIRVQVPEPEAADARELLNAPNAPDAPAE
jgi:hypothetical protein